MDDPRSDVFLELIYDDPKVFEGQRGHNPPLQTTKPVFCYVGKRFPFEDQEFDYVICSQVLEHVVDVNNFTAEIMRVAKKGYIEFPTIYYDFLYDFPEHVTLLFLRDGIIFNTKKETKIQSSRLIAIFVLRKQKKRLLIF